MKKKISDIILFVFLALFAAFLLFAVMPAVVIPG